MVPHGENNFNPLSKMWGVNDIIDVQSVMSKTSVRIYSQFPCSTWPLAVVVHKYCTVIVLQHNIGIFKVYVPSQSLSRHTFDNWPAQTPDINPIQNQLNASQSALLNIKG